MWVLGVKCGGLVLHDLFVRIFLSENRRTGPLPHPTTLKYTSVGGRVGERAGAAPDESRV